MKFRLFILVFVLALVTSARAQDIKLGKGWNKDKKGQKNFIRANDYFEQGDYLLALPLYRALKNKYGNNPFLVYRTGICLLYKTDETDSALYYLQLVKTKNPKAADIDLYLARAYHLNSQFDEALACLVTYEAQKNLPKAKRDEADRLRLYCQNAKILVADPVKAKIINIGPPVNTDNSEYVPVVSTDDSVMLFTYRGIRSTGGLQSYPGTPDSSGNYYEDVFYTARTDSGWSYPEALDSTINGNGHDACIGISNDGQTLLIYKDESGNGDIYISTLMGFYWSAPVPLKGDVNSDAWEGSATFSADMHTLYFASERPGGYGGRDIWMATLQPDGTWGNVKNLGPKINTPYNEDAPFLHPNGVTLIFSSEGHNSMGGYDIFRTTLTPVDSTFSDASDPVNVGYPINTPGDDKYFVLATDGKHGYYSSGKSGGFGQQDIYMVESDFHLDSASVMLLSGTVTLNDKPVEANIIVHDSKGQLRNLDIYSNLLTGKYMVTLPLNRDYIITYRVQDQVSQVDSVDAVQAMQMQTKIIDKKFYTPGWLDSTRRADSLVARADSVRAIHPPPDITVQDYNDVFKLYGNAKSPGLIFRVQIAAYNIPKNYRMDKMKQFGKISKIKLDDNITRFTLGQFDTLNEAEAFRQRVIAAGQTDAFVTAEKDGKRYLMKQLYDLHFFQK